MSRNVEDLLREGVDRAAASADPDVPATLLRRARQHNRRRRQAIAGVVAAGAAAVTAAAVIVATSTSGTSPNALHGETITYVTTRAEQALAQLNPGRAIEQDTLTARNGDFNFTVLNTAPPAQGSALVPRVLQQVHASYEVDWAYDGLYLQQGYSAAGKLVFTAAVGPKGAYGAAYPARVQWHNPLSNGQTGPNPAANCENARFGYPDWKKAISKALSCHEFSLDGNQQVAGVDTIKLIGKPVTAEGQSIRQTLWVDPKTYLPLRTTTTFTEPHHRAAALTDDFRWLPPAKANLGTLHAAEQRSTIPPGFRALPSTYLPLPGFNGPLR